MEREDFIWNETLVIDRSSLSQLRVLLSEILVHYCEAVLLLGDCDAQGKLWGLRKMTEHAYGFFVRIYDVIVNQLKWRL